MDTTKLVVGQDVFMRSGLIGNWAKVVEVTSTGVIVESDPDYGARLFRFDRNGMACDSSDLCNDKGVRGGPIIPKGGTVPRTLHLDPELKMLNGESVESLLARRTMEHRKRLASGPKNL
jgi:hypothetical protein